MNAMRRFPNVLALAALAIAAASCGDVVRDGRAPMFLVIDLLQGSAQGGRLSTTVAVRRADRKGRS